MVRPGIINGSASATGVTVTTTAETVACAILGISFDRMGASIILEGHVDVTLSAAATAMTVQIRRGNGVTGAVVGTADVPAVTASTRVVFPYQTTDAPGEVHNQAYSLTVAVAGASGNSTVNYASLFATY